MPAPRLWLIVPAAGIGQRMQSEQPKQYLRLGDRAILDITLSRLLDSAPFAGCMVPLHAADRWWADTDASADSRIQTCTGGSERSCSVLSALRALAEQVHEDDWVLVHDAARPCLHTGDLANLINSVYEHAVGGLLATPVADTLKRVDASEPPEVVETVDRQGLWRALTPQMFRYGLLVRALEHAVENSLAVTDEASAMELAGHRPVLVEGRPDNLKITLPADLALAGFILGQI